MAAIRQPRREKFINDLTAKYIRSILHYDPISGFFTYKIRRGKKRVGDRAGHTAKRYGYVYIGIGGRFYLAHRLAWLYVKGKWPTRRVDHEDRNPSHNWWTNLRQATHAQNMANSKIKKNNTSGYRGVHKRNNGWRAAISANNRHYHLGDFNTAQEAAAAYNAASIELRGKFACLD